MDGPTIIAGVSVVVAGTTSVLAPIIAGRNQRISDEARLEHEATANAERLKHERATQAAQFAFERASRIDEEQRSLLNATALSISVAQAGVSTLLTRVTMPGSQEEHVGPDSPGLAEFKSYADASAAVNQNQTRLVVLLGRDAEPTIACREVAAAIAAVGISCTLIINGHKARPDDWPTVCTEYLVRVRDTYEAFLDAAARHVRGGSDARG